MYVMTMNPEQWLSRLKEMLSVALLVRHQSQLSAKARHCFGSSAQEYQHIKLRYKKAHQKVG